MTVIVTNVDYISFINYFVKFIKVTTAITIRIAIIDDYYCSLQPLIAISWILATGNQ
jgi:hypothetical protein